MKISLNGSNEKHKPTNKRGGSIEGILGLSNCKENKGYFWKRIFKDNIENSTIMKGTFENLFETFVLNSNFDPSKPSPIPIPTPDSSFPLTISTFLHFPSRHRSNCRLKRLPEDGKRRNKNKGKGRDLRSLSRNDVQSYGEAFWCQLPPIDQTPLVLSIMKFFWFWCRTFLSYYFVHSILFNSMPNSSNDQLLGMSRFAEIFCFLSQNCKVGLEWGWCWCWLWGIYIYHIEPLTCPRNSSLCLFLARSSTSSALGTFVSKYVLNSFLGFHLSSFFYVLLGLFIYLCWCIWKSIWSHNSSNRCYSCQVKILEWNWRLYVHGSPQASLSSNCSWDWYF